MEKGRTACPLDCPDACSLEVKTEAGRLVSVHGTSHNAYTEDYLCGKVRGIAAHVYDERRVGVPKIRVGEKGTDHFRDASWDEALDLIASRFKEIAERAGGEAILPCAYGGSNGKLSDGTVDERFFRRLGASRMARTMCAKPTGAAAQGLYGRMTGVALSDYVHSKLIVIWGANPASSGIHHVPLVREAKRRGATLVVVDPRRTPLAKQADLHLALRPGTDLVVALAVVRWLFENGHDDAAFLAEHTTGADALREKAAPWTIDRAATEADVPADHVVALARMWAELSPAVMRCGWGLERNRNGGSASAAVVAIPAVAGAFGLRGGGYTMSNNRAFTTDADAAIRAPEAPTRVISQREIGRALLEVSEPRIEALFVYDSNILATAPAQERVRQGLLRPDLFTVVYDQVMTDSTLYADVVLPATTFLEHDDLAVGYGAMVMNDVRPVIDRVGESRPNQEVFAELCRRCGLHEEGDPESADELRAALLGKSPAIAAGMAEHGFMVAPTGLTPIQFVDAFPRTSDRKVHLHPDDLARDALGGLYVYKSDPTTPDHPLALVTPSTAKRVNSTFGQLYEYEVPIGLHPTDAAARGIADGDLVRMFNDLGEVVCPARIDDDLRPGLVSHPKGLWRQNTRNGSTNNALCPDTAADLGDGACYSDARVQVERVADE
ncbi:MAG: molybdopterin-binding oxidoreductase [Planctomycetes bacterium]|nr:molybdopterin-binding oxidoreductase [Planctomycetota bacterium]